MPTYSPVFLLLLLLAYHRLFLSLLSSRHTFLPIHSIQQGKFIQRLDILELMFYIYHMQTASYVLCCTKRCCSDKRRPLPLWSKPFHPTFSLIQHVPDSLSCCWTPSHNIYVKYSFFPLSSRHITGSLLSPSWTGDACATMAVNGSCRWPGDWSLYVWTKLYDNVQRLLYSPCWLLKS